MRQDKQEAKKKKKRDRWLVMEEKFEKLREHLLSEVCVKIESESFVCAWQMCRNGAGSPYLWTRLFWGITLKRQKEHGAARA